MVLWKKPHFLFAEPWKSAGKGIFIVILVIHSDIIIILTLDGRGDASGRARALGRGRRLRTT